jgi:photosystem II stability/assembly factor-like uncharacterized protein
MRHSRRSSKRPGSAGRHIIDPNGKDDTVTGRTVLLLLLAMLAPSAAAQKSRSAPAGGVPGELLSGLTFRPLGPAVTSGRVGDIAVDPKDKSRWFVAVASGGVWKTVNAGTTWEPVFDGEGSYSIGCVTIDPTNSNVIWVGSGENNSQRSVAYGDGVYRSEDGGKSWKNMGLTQSRHIGRMTVDPRNPSIVYVAAMGPLWGPGGDRGLYKTTDAGKTWKAVLTVSKNTGVVDVVADPRDPNLLYAASYQRRRHVWTIINGGPESAIHKSTDGGATWKKVASGLPSEDLGRIGLAVSPVNPDVVYATVEASQGKGGFFRSPDRGETWERRSGYFARSAQYYAEIVPDPKQLDRVYAMDVYMMVTDDGGKSFRRLGEKSKHVDNHALWIDPDDTDHYLCGGDGGVYESFDRAETWRFLPNLPVTQFYRVAVDNSTPFYYVYGGTQDNATLGGPSRTTSVSGIANSDWFITVMGDGFGTQVDPTNPDIVYSMSQYGGIMRYDRKTGELTGIKPVEGPDEGAYRWNWDSPLLISPHAPTRLYFAANRVFRSDDRGDSWRAVSPDLTRQIDRNMLPVMDRVWSVDAVARGASTSFYGNIVSFDESPMREGLLYAGTDDGLVQVTEDGGGSWRRIERFPGVPERTYVSRLTASVHQPQRVYAAFDNHKNNDFYPYLLRSDDAGGSWTSIAKNLPEGTVYALAEDHVDPGLLFAGTEFGVFVSTDGGGHWTAMKGGLPTIAVRDIAIQRRENDLVLATFGRGFYVLDDYTPLRSIAGTVASGAPAIFPVKEAKMFVESRPFGLRGKAFQGESYYAAPNPPVGAVFTYYLPEGLKTRKQARQDAEKKAVDKGEKLPFPSFEELRREDAEEPPAVWLSVRDEAGTVIRRIPGSVKKGIHRVAWDFRYPATVPVNLTEQELDTFSEADAGPLTVPGAYTVTLSRRVEGESADLAGPVRFTTAPLGATTLPAADRQAALAFQKRVGELQRAVYGSVRLTGELRNRTALIRKAISETPGAPETLRAELAAVETTLASVDRALRGDQTLRTRNEPVPPSITERVDGIIGDQILSLSAPTGTHRGSFEAASAGFGPVLARLRTVAETDLPRIEAALEAAGGPWTPGRVPSWNR